MEINTKEKSQVSTSSDSNEQWEHFCGSAKHAGPALKSRTEVNEILRLQNKFPILPLSSGCGRHQNIRNKKIKKIKKFWIHSRPDQPAGWKQFWWVNSP